MPSDMAYKGILSRNAVMQSSFVPGSNSCGKFVDYSPSFAASPDAFVNAFSRASALSTHHWASLSIPSRRARPEPSSGGERTNLMPRGSVLRASPTSPSSGN